MALYYTSTIRSSKGDAADLEPNNEWEKQLKARIQLEFQSLVQDAKDTRLEGLRKAVVTPEERNRLDNEYKATMASIKQLANDQYQAELEKRRKQRRWIVGEPTSPDWSTYRKAEREHIMQADDQLAPADSSEQPCPHLSSPSPPQAAPPLNRMARASESRKAHVFNATGPDVGTTNLSGRRTASYESIHIRPSKLYFRLEEDDSQQKQCKKYSVNQDHSSPQLRVDDVLRSQDNWPSPADQWKRKQSGNQDKRRARRDIRSIPVGAGIPFGVTISRHDEPLVSRRRIRSAGPSFTTIQYTSPGSSMRSLANQSSNITEDRELYYKDWSPYLDPRNEHYSSHQEPRYPFQEREPPRPLSPRSYSAPPANLHPPQPLPPRSPYNGDREYSPIRDSLARLPFLRSYTSEDRKYCSLPPDARYPVTPRSPHGDDYNHSSMPHAQYINSRKGSFTDWKYGPPSTAHNDSFNYDDHRQDSWESSDREPFWDGKRDREHLDWERGRNRERDRYAHSDGPGYCNHYSYDPPQHFGSYHTPPASISRRGSRDYLPMGDLYNARESGPPSRGYSYHNHSPVTPPLRSASPKEYDDKYQRQENSSPMLSARQRPYSKRRSRDRRMENSEPRDDRRHLDDEEPTTSDDDDDDDVIGRQIAEPELQSRAYELSQQIRDREDKARRKEEDVARMEEEVLRRERYVWGREQALRVREEELKRREVEARMKSEEAEGKGKVDSAQVEMGDAPEGKQIRIAGRTRHAEEDIAGPLEIRRADKGMGRIAEQARYSTQETEWPMFDINSPFLAANDLSDDPLGEEQEYVWQQVQNQEQADAIQRIREETRLCHDGLEIDTSPRPYPQKELPQPLPMSSNCQTPFSQSSSFSSPSSSEKSTSTSSAWNGVGSAWSSSTTSISSATSATSVISSHTPNGAQTPNPVMNISPRGKPQIGSLGSGSYPAGSSLHSTSNTDEWQCRQTEFTNAQQQKFRCQQEKMEADLEMRLAGKPLSRDDMQKIFEKHEQFWTQLPQKSDLTWNDFPWPMSKSPASPDDISSVLIGVYVHSSCWLDKDKSKSTKDRIKDHLKRWHPDRFETRLLPKVIESEKDKVKQGASNVARCLSNLLRKELDHSKFGLDDGNQRAALAQQESSYSEKIVSGQLTADMFNTTNDASPQQQQLQASVDMSNEEEHIHTFAKATVVRYRPLAVPTYVRLRRISNNLFSGVAKDAAIASATPVPASSVGVSTEERMAEKVAKFQKVTIDDVPDEEEDYHGERLPVDSWLILDDALVVAPSPKFNP